MQIKNIKVKVKLSPEEIDDLAEVLISDYNCNLTQYCIYVDLATKAFELGASLGPNELKKKVPSLFQKPKTEV